MTWESRIIGHGVMDPHELIPNPKNWRTHPKLQEKALEGALEDIGWIQDVIVNERTGKLLDGHLRVELAKKRGEHKIPVVMVDLSEEEEELALITLDPITAMAEADKDMLNDLIERCKTDNQKVKDLLQNIAEKEKLPIGKKQAEEDDYEPPAEIETDIVRGDIYQLGRHRVMCGDSTSKEDVEKLMDGATIDLVISSPPYWNQREYSQWDSFDGYLEDMARVWDNIKMFLKDGGILFWNIGDDSPNHRHISAHHSIHIESKGFVYIDSIIWKKPGITGIRLSHQKQHNKYYPGFCFEPLLVFQKPGGEFPTFDPGSSDIPTGNVWEFATENQMSGKHSAPFPIKIPYTAASCYSTIGQSIYDPFLGSGTTLIACEQLDRICYGMEISPQYCEVISQRWEKLTGEKREKIIEGV